MTGTLLQNVCARAAEVLVGSAWMGLALVACAALLLRCVPRLSAGVRAAVWTVVLLMVLCLPLLSLRGGAGAAESGVVHAGADWSLAIVAAWLVMAAWRVTQLAVSAMRLHGIARRALPVEPSEAVAALLRQGSRTVSLSVSDDVSRPSVAGFFRPQILLPVGLLDELSEAELEHVALHEMEHLRRRDDWTNLLQKVGLAVFPLHPALFWLDRQLCRERELACDDSVLRVTQARKAYAACLTRLAEDSMARRGLLLALGLLGVRERRSELSGRVHRILRSPVEAISRMQMRFALAAMTTAVLGGTVLLARSPRLVSFGEVPQMAAQSEGASVMGSRPVPTFGAPRMVAAKAVMPRRQAPHVTRAVAAVRKSHAVLRQVAFEQTERTPEFRVVMTAWHAEMEAPRLTLAVATDGFDTASRPQVPQATYAAVPVRGGWLLIQL